MWPNKMCDLFLVNLFINADFCDLECPYAKKVESHIVVESQTCFILWLKYQPQYHYRTIIDHYRIIKVFLCSYGFLNVYVVECVWVASIV